jgi:Fe(3+) dicitrate transport protein
MPSRRLDSPLFVGLIGLSLAATPLLGTADEASAEVRAVADQPADQAAPTNAGAGPTAADVDYALTELVNVVGSAESLPLVPGSAHVIGVEQLKRKSHDDIHRILQDVPGINVQEEDGYGLRPNIGMRGTGVERSQKITVMEDGVLIAPAPYAAPAAYYFPTPGRMESMEVRKGSASIKQGPYTTGGALNLLSAAIPAGLGASFDGAGGSDDAFRLEALVGHSGERMGWLLQSYQLDTGGFKRLDGGGDTATELEDYLGKLRFGSGSGAAIHQSLELKLGVTTQLGNETYLGLTESDFEANPVRRYRASALDHIDSDHEQFQLRYFIVPSASVDVVTTIYRNNFFRDWFKNESVAGVSNARVLGDPASYPVELGILRGEIDSQPEDLALRHNRRDYYSSGISTTAGIGGRWGASDHRLELGLRYHEDEEDRFQEEDLYSMTGGQLELDRLGAPGSNSNRIGDAKALAFFVQDRISLGRLSLLPGLRWESISHRRFDFSRDDPSRSSGPVSERRNDVDVLLPGLGMSFDLAGGHGLLAGVHRGFSPPGTGSTAEVDAEESVNWELGYRFRHRTMHAEVVGFFNDYDNLLGAETVAGGGSEGGELFNGGEVEVLGLEASFGYRPRLGRYSVPLNLSYTYTTSEFQTSFKTTFADWAPAVEAGDELPYLPQGQLTANAGLTAAQWSLYLTASWMDAMRTRAGQGAIPEGEGTDARFVLDLGGRWQAFERVSFYAHLRNLSDESYVVSRRPYGLRGGLPRTLLAGVSFDW